MLSLGLPKAVLTKENLRIVYSCMPIVYKKLESVIKHARSKIPMDNFRPANQQNSDQVIV